MELTLGTLVRINDPSNNIEGLTGVVLAQNNNEVSYRIVAENYIGLATHTTNRWCCEVIGRYEGNLKY
jgi:hypothetical protein